VAYRKVAEIFSQISGVYDRFLSLATAGQIHRWQRDLLSGMNMEGNWLDVGTGTGELLRKLGEDWRGIRVGIDPALGMLFVAKKKCPGCFFLQAVGESLPFREGSFRNVSLSLVFRHLEDKEAFLKDAFRVLESGGRIGILDIGRFRGTGVLLLLMKTLLKPLGVLIFGSDKWSFFIHSVEDSLSPEEVEAMLRSSGFSVISKERRLLGVVHLIVAVKTA